MLKVNIQLPDFSLLYTFLIQMAHKKDSWSVRERKVTTKFFCSFIFFLIGWLTLLAIVSSASAQALPLCSNNRFRYVHLGQLLRNLTHIIKVRGKDQLQRGPQNILQTLAFLVHPPPPHQIIFIFLSNLPWGLPLPLDAKTNSLKRQIRQISQIYEVICYSKYI